MKIFIIKKGIKINNSSSKTFASLKNAKKIRKIFEKFYFQMLFFSVQ